MQDALEITIVVSHGHSKLTESKDWGHTVHCMT